MLIFLVTNVKALDTSATSHILIDADNNRIIDSNNIHNKRSVASISKIMTCILALENKDINDEVIVGNEIENAYGSSVYLKKGEKLKLIDLLYALMLRSGNDAALVIAKYVSGDIDTFVSLMNVKAKTLGMKDSTFNNPCGLDEEDEGNISTAYDMAILTSYAYKNKTFKKIISTVNYKVKTNQNIYSWNNKHKLLKEKNIIGGKTGFTNKARRTLVTIASKKNVNLIAVTLNDGNDWIDHMGLFEMGFKEYKKYKIVKKGTIFLYNEKYYKDYDLYIKENYSLTLTEEERKNIVLKYEISDTKKENIGKLKIILYDEVLKEIPIYLKEKNKRNNLEKIKEWFMRLW